MLLLALTLAAPAVTPPPVVEPGVRLGPIALGMDKAALAATGLPITDGALTSHLNVGPYDVRLKDGKAVSVSLNLTPELAAVRIKDQIITPKSPEDLARHLGACGPLQMNTGGNIIECADGAMAGQHLGGLMIRVSTPRPIDDAPTCAGYVVPGQVGDKLVIEAGQSVCAGTRVLTRDVRQPDVLGRLAYNTCQVEPNEGATVVTCPYQGVRLIFAAPSGELARVEGVEMKR
ncbi:MAG: hypothetical protein H6706_19740 [Myxococcales bacterium]|nr:hypothetical protein [Myxococcales bacterium]